ncbi:MAG TPA: YHYH protein [Anaerolineae bacterium]|nr:YHYH protein [Anaerolineae bacterium]
MKYMITLLVGFSLYLTACAGPPAAAPTEAPVNNETGAEATHEHDDTAAHTHTADDNKGLIQLDYFQANGLVESPELVDCRLEDGTMAQCAQIVTNYRPEDLEIGPFCPETVDDTGGIWDWDGDNGGLYRLNSDFFTMVVDQGYTFFDEEGYINIADPGAPRAGGGGAGGNNCLEATEDSSVVITVLIPIEPVMATTPTNLGTVAQVGLALDGVPIFADAPSATQTGALPALDTCGGHVDPGGWYHWHATATDMASTYAHNQLAETDCHLAQSATALFGYAFDGYPIYGSAEQDGSLPADLDACNGHTAATAEYPDGVYHYHASLTFPNLPNCLRGVLAEGKFSTTASQGVGSANGGGPGGAGGPGGPGGPGGGAGGNGGPGGPGGGGGGNGTPPDFAEAAATLGVTEQALRDALGGPPPDFEAAAATLGIPVATLQEALLRR